MAKRHEGVYVKAAEILYLPTQLTLEDGRDIHVDYATEDQIPQVYKLLEDCRERGDNVAEGEFDDYEDWYEDIACHSWVFTATRGGDVIGGALLRPYRHSRSVIPGTVELFLHLTREFQHVAVKPLVSLAERLALDLKLRYFAITLGVFYSNQKTLLALNSLSYLVSAIIPKSGTVKGVGLMENCIMTKLIAPIAETYHLKPEYLELVKSLGLDDPDDDLTDADFPQIPNLPVTVTSDLPGGRDLLIRNLEMRDHAWLYGMLTRAAEAGYGYSVDEFPPYEMYRQTMLVHEHVAVVELAGDGEEGGEKIAAQMYYPSAYNRGQQRHMVDTAMVVDTRYKGAGIGREMMNMWFGICKELGYTAALTSVMLNNPPSFAMARANDMAWVGAIPFAGYMKGAGWTTTGLCYKPLDTCKTYSQILQERQQAKAKAKL